MPVNILNHLKPMKRVSVWYQNINREKRNHMKYPTHECFYIVVRSKGPLNIEKRGFSNILFSYLIISVIEYVWSIIKIVNP